MNGGSSVVVHNGVSLASRDVSLSGRLQRLRCRLRAAPSPALVHLRCDLLLQRCDRETLR